MQHTIEWHTPAPLWDRTLEGSGPARLQFFKAPLLLRFASDGFMQELENQLARDPAGLADYVVRPESWREQAAGWLAPDHSESSQPVTLFQPVHSRFYLAAVSLVCRLPGLPERAVNAAARERVSFIMRRIVGGNEYAWIGDRQQGSWQLADPANRVMNNEEQLALFPVNLIMEGRKRRLFAGLIPVAGREVYEAGARALRPPPSADELQGDPLADPRLAEFGERIITALQSFADFPAPPDELTGDARDTAQAQLDRQAREVLAFLLLDLSEWVQTYLSEVWAALEAGSESGLSDEDAQLYHYLDSSLNGSTPWRALLLDMETHRQALLTQDFETLDSNLSTANLTAAEIAGAAALLLGDATGGLRARVESALAARPLPPPPVDSPPAEDNDSDAGGVYVLRCVYERPRCQPFIDPLVSDPSRRFRLASFFDPDAPVRPVRIRMPVDTSLKGLKGFPKAVSVLLSKKLRQQMERAQQAGMEGLTEQKLGAEPAINLGVICSFSIPIITLCALILLMIIVQLLNIVFWWLPLFRICFPVRS